MSSMKREKRTLLMLSVLAVFLLSIVVVNTYAAVSIEKVKRDTASCSSGDCSCSCVGTGCDCDAADGECTCECTVGTSSSCTDNSNNKE